MTATQIAEFLWSRADVDKKLNIDAVSVELCDMIRLEAALRTEQAIRELRFHLRAEK